MDLNLPVIDDAFFQVDEGVENEENFDWFHANSIEYDKSRNEIVISGRHQGLIGLDYENIRAKLVYSSQPRIL